MEEVAERRNGRDSQHADAVTEACFLNQVFNDKRILGVAGTWPHSYIFYLYQNTCRCNVPLCKARTAVSGRCYTNCTTKALQQQID